ncbi:hypothetical protein B6D60_05080 [candidate division KSB1 bacterium 4484_87]|nr:MAG: hypothetical protein B6D60_05080 [candidate division KSB1 bacterium 4484_87]
MKKTRHIFLFAILFIIFSCREKIPSGPERVEVLKVYLFSENGRMDFAQENHFETRFRLPPKYLSMEEFDYRSKWVIRFGVNVLNDFDEAMEGKKWIVIKVNLWPKDETETWRAEVVYTDTNFVRNMVIPPGDSLTFFSNNMLVWHQQGIDGKSIHKTNSFNPIWVTCAFYDSIVPGTKPEEIIQMRQCDTTYLAPVDSVIAFGEPKEIYAQAEVQLFKNYHSVVSDTLTLRIHYYFPGDGFYRKFWCKQGPVMANDPPCNTDPPPP